MPVKGQSSGPEFQAAERKASKRRTSTLDKVAPQRKGKKRVKKTEKKYKVPSEDDIIEAIQKAMTGNNIVRSQTELRALVQAELKTKDPAFSITNERLRRIALEKVGLAIEIQGRDLEGGPPLVKCPVCKSPLKATKNVTIYGGTVNLGFTCTKCPYWTGVKRRVPTRYTFYKRKT
jgi:hypothetical protein